MPTKIYLPGVPEALGWLALLAVVMTPPCSWFLQYIVVLRHNLRHILIWAELAALHPEFIRNILFWWSQSNEIISKQGLSIIVKELLIDIPISWRFPSAALVTSGCTKSLLKWIPKTSELYSSIALETFFRLLARRRLLSEGISPRILDTHSIQIKLNIVESLLIEVFIW